jgi:hypothetical protein
MSDTLYADVSEWQVGVGQQLRLVPPERRWRSAGNVGDLNTIWPQKPTG